MQVSHNRPISGFVEWICKPLTILCQDDFEADFEWMPMPSIPKYSYVLVFAYMYSYSDVFWFGFLLILVCVLSLPSFHYFYV
jgi:hypothetical protein